MRDAGFYPEGCFVRTCRHRGVGTKRSGSSWLSLIRVTVEVAGQELAKHDFM